MTVAQLPLLNASFNALAMVFLLAGWKTIRAGRKKAHAFWMGMALVASTCFLASYVLYHYLTKGVVTKYAGTGLARGIYYFILLTHIPLAGIILPFCLAVVYWALRKDLDRHKRLARWVMPVWLYVSVTGVLIYWTLYH